MIYVIHEGYEACGPCGAYVQLHGACQRFEGVQARRFKVAKENIVRGH